MLLHQITPANEPHAPLPRARSKEETIATRVWLEEYVYLQALYASVENCSPKFRLPDLISACVSLVFQDKEPDQQIFNFLHTEIVMRDPDSPRRQEAMWRQQYQLLLRLQKSPANGHPHPQFKLDHFTTACVALAAFKNDAKRRIFALARCNTLERARRAP